MTDDVRKWHDFILGIHHRSCQAVDKTEWNSWEVAGQTFYGEEKYDTIRREYHRRVANDKIN